MKTTLYSRVRGCICYEAPLFAQHTDINSVIQHLLTLELDWYWESQRSRPLSDEPEEKTLPLIRQLTLLSAINANILYEDLTERDIDGYGRFLALCGVHPRNAKSQLLNRDQFNNMLEDFALNEDGPIQVVIIQVGDSPTEQLYVKHIIVDPVMKLLKALGIDHNMPKIVLPYRRLRLIALERIYTLKQGLL